METEFKSEKYSLRDGTAFAVLLGGAEAYFGAFAVFLRASTLQLGILATLPVFVGNLSHVAGVWVSDRLRFRRRPIACAALFHAATLLPIAALALMQPRAGSIIFFFWCLVFFYVIQGLIVPSWNSLIGDIIDPERRPIFFARRTRRVALSTFLSTLAAGSILSFWQKIGAEKWGFATIFLIAAIARTVSAHALSNHDDPEYVCDKSERFTFIRFIRRAKHSNFVKFAFFYGAVNFGVAFASPYFAPYMLRDLGLSYAEFTSIIGAGVISQVLALIYWAKLSQRLGNKRILEICGYGVTIVPLLWLISPAVLYLVVIQIFSGLIWSGFNLAAQNFLFEAVTPPKRARCSAYMMIINGFCVLSGSLLGGYTATLLPPMHTFFGRHAPGSVLLWIFMASSILRLLAIRVFLNKFQEVREVQHVPIQTLFFRPAYLRAFAGFRFAPLPDGRPRKKPSPEKSDQ